MQKIYADFCRLRDLRDAGMEAPKYTESQAFEMSITATVRPDSGQDVALVRAVDCLEILNKRPRPMCRDCADHDGICPSGGMDCDMRTLIAKARTALAAHPTNCPQAGDATPNAEPVWAALTEAGQVKKGDKLRFNIGDKAYSETARQILFAGTDKEEVVYNKYQNFYFITSMAINGSSSHKNVEILAAAKKGGAA